MKEKEAGCIKFKYASKMFIHENDPKWQLNKNWEHNGLRRSYNHFVCLIICHNLDQYLSFE